MVIYLARHGDASKTAPGQPSLLTAKGRTDITRTISKLREKDARFSRVWHSPKPRASQTAALYRDALGTPGLPLEEMEELSPGGDASLVLGKILEEKTGSLLIVSHLPLLGHLASLMLEVPPENLGVPFPTSGVACFREKSSQIWECVWTVDAASK